MQVSGGDSPTEKVVEELGGPHGFRQIQRQSEKGDIWYGHALPDLIEAWDYLHPLGEKLEEE